MKTKIKPNGDNVANIYEKKFPKVDSNHNFLTVISLDSSLNKDDSCYPQVFLKKSRYIEKKVVRHIHDNLNDFSYSSYSSVEE